MLVDLFDYELPPERIARWPRPRGSSRLLFVPRGQGPFRHAVFDQLPDFVRPGDLLVRNDARVFPARLTGHVADRKVEILLLEGPDVAEADCLARPASRLRIGARVVLAGGVEAEVVGEGVRGRRRVRFTPPLSGALLSRIGEVPLPPYLRRAADKSDRSAYQTVYASADGAVAAPTAGLHFTVEMLARIRDLGVEIADLTLKVGAGTFRPVTASDTTDHRMDAEDVVVPASTVERISECRARGGRVVAVGTTVVRALEAWVREDNAKFSTRLFIEPGFSFRVVDALLTNFHLPRSTLLMLVAAFAGRERLLAAYGEAIANGYLFYSYGDAMFVATGA